MELDDSTMEVNTTGLDDYEHVQEVRSPVDEVAQDPATKFSVTNTTTSNMSPAQPISTNTTTSKTASATTNTSQQPIKAKPTPVQKKNMKRSSLLQELIAWYMDLLSKFPIPTKMVTAALVQFCGSVVSQKFVRKVQSIDWQSIIKFTATGALVSPLSHFWFQNLDKIMKALEPFFRAVKKQTAGLIPIEKIVSLGLDQLVFAPFINIAFISSLALFDNKVAQIPENLRRDLWPTLTRSWMVWPFAAYVNLNYIPSQLRVLFGNFIGFFWSIYLSYTL